MESIKSDKFSKMAETEISNQAQNVAAKQSGHTHTIGNTHTLTSTYIIWDDDKEFSHDLSCDGDAASPKTLKREIIYLEKDIIIKKNITKK